MQLLVVLNDLFALRTKYYSRFQIKKTEMGGACDIRGGGVHAVFWCGNLRKKHLEDLGIDGSRILNRLSKQDCGVHGLD
jgi:hypothetical protein